MTGKEGSGSTEEEGRDSACKETIVIQNFNGKDHKVRDNKTMETLITLVLGRGGGGGGGGLKYNQMEIFSGLRDSQLGA